MPPQGEGMRPPLLIGLRFSVPGRTWPPCGRSTLRNSKSEPASSISRQAGLGGHFHSWETEPVAWWMKALVLPARQGLPVTCLPAVPFVLCGRRSATHDDGCRRWPKGKQNLPDTLPGSGHAQRGGRGGQPTPGKRVVKGGCRRAEPPAYRFTFSPQGTEQD